MSESLVRLRVYAVLLVLLAPLSACGDSPMSPDPVGAAQESTAAMLAQILDKLGDIEERIDSLEATVAATGGGELVLTGLPAAQLDSIIALTSFMSHEMISGGLEACADGGKITAKAEVGVALKIEGAGGVEYCHPLFASTPPARPAPVGPLRSADLDQLGQALDGITSQFNLTPATLSQSLGGIGSAIGAPGNLNLQTLGSVVPLPPAMASLATNPLGTLSGHPVSLRASRPCSATVAGDPICRTSSSRRAD